MRIFVSWSGDLSLKVARVLKEWLPNVIQSIEVWVSTEDIGKGKRWSDEISSELDRCSFGIVCLTADNLVSPWVHFEAGAIAKTLPGSLEQGRVTPLLVGVAPSAVTGPLAVFQATSFERDDLSRLLRDINQVSEGPLDPNRLAGAFDLWWPQLERQVAELMADAAKSSAADRKDPPIPGVPAPSDELLERILQSVRSHERSLLRLERGLRGDSIVWHDRLPGAIIRWLDELKIESTSITIREVDDSVRVTVHTMPSTETLRLLDRYASKAGVALEIETTEETFQLGTRAKEA